MIELFFVFYGCRDINDTLSPQYWYMPWLVSLAVTVLVIVCIFLMRKKISALFGIITSRSSEENEANEDLIL